MRRKYFFINSKNNLTLFSHLGIHVAEGVFLYVFLSLRKLLLLSNFNSGERTFNKTAYGLAVWLVIYVRSLTAKIIKHKSLDFVMRKKYFDIHHSNNISWVFKEKEIVSNYDEATLGCMVLIKVDKPVKMIILILTLFLLQQR